MKNILIVDDHPFILDAYETLIKDSENIDVKYIHKATSIEKAIYLINEYQIDVAILDISMPKNNTSKMEDGIDLATYLKKNSTICENNFHYNAYGISHIIKSNLFY